MLQEADKIIEAVTNTEEIRNIIGYIEYTRPTRQATRKLEEVAAKMMAQVEGKTMALSENDVKEIMEQAKDTRFEIERTARYLEEELKQFNQQPSESRESLPICIDVLRSAYIEALRTEYLVQTIQNYTEDIQPVFNKN